MDVLALQSAQFNSLLTQNIEPISKESVESSLARRSIKTQTLSVSENIVRLQIPTVGYGTLMEWLLENQKVTRLTVEDAKLIALPELGQVSATLTLKQQRAE